MTKPASRHLPSNIHRTTINGCDVRSLRAGSGTPVVFVHTLRTQLESDPDQPDYQARRTGPTLLWDDIESILTGWQLASRPPQLTFGLTVTPHGQRLRLGCPDALTWPARQMP
jgi:hypothetical protein